MSAVKPTVPMAALAAVIATPLFAQALSGTTDLEGSVGVGGTADATASAGVGAEVNATANDAPREDVQAETTVAPGARAETNAAAEDVAGAAMPAIQAGDATVMSSNDAVVGTIESVETGADGKLRYRVSVNEALGIDVERVTLVSGAGLNSEGALKLRMTDEEFAAAATRQAEAMSEGEAEVN